METIEQLSNQLRVLKQTVIQEKDQRKENFKLIETIKSQIRSLDSQSSTLSVIFEKKLKEKTLIDEDLKKAQEALKLAQTKANPLKKSFKSSKSIIALQAQNEKLKEEYIVLQTEHKTDEQSIYDLKKKYSFHYEDITHQDRTKLELNEKCVDKQELSLKAQKKTQEELQEIHRIKLRIIEKNEEMTELLQKNQRKNERLTQDLENLKKYIGLKVELQNGLHESLNKHEKIEVELLRQIQEAKADLFDSKSFFQVFPIRLTCLMMQYEGYLVIRKSENNDFLLEITHKGKAERVLLSQLEDIYEHPTKDNRVVFKYKSKTKDIITEHHQKILARLRELQLRSRKLG